MSGICSGAGVAAAGAVPSCRAMRSIVVCICRAVPAARWRVSGGRRPMACCTSRICCCIDWTLGGNVVVFVAIRIVGLGGATVDAVLLGVVLMAGVAEPSGFGVMAADSTETAVGAPVGAVAALGAHAVIPISSATTSAAASLRIQDTSERDSADRFSPLELMKARYWG